MRVGVLLSLGSPWARNFALGLSAAGVDVHAIDFARPDTEGYYLSVDDAHQAADLRRFRDGVAAVHALESRYRRTLPYVTTARALRRLADAAGLDALLTLYGGGRALQAYLSGGRPYAVYVVGGDVLMTSGVRGLLAARCLERAGEVFANGRYLAERTRALAPGARVTPLYLGVDVERFAPAPRSADVVDVICTRGFNEVYNNAYVLDALAALPPGLPDWRLTFASGGPLLPDARARADRLPESVRRRVRFLGGVPGSELRALVRGAHVYVSVSRSDGTSVSLLEALACGALPVLSDIPQNAEWVLPGLDNVLLAPLDDPPALARALAHAIADGDLQRRAADVNRQLACARADARAAIAHVAESLRALVARATSRRASSRAA